MWCSSTSLTDSKICLLASPCFLVKQYLSFLLYYCHRDINFFAYGKLNNKNFLVIISKVFPQYLH